MHTGSQAMHSERMLIFEPADSKLRSNSVGQFNGMVVSAAELMAGARGFAWALFP